MFTDVSEIMCKNFPPELSLRRFRKDENHLEVYTCAFLDSISLAFNIFLVVFMARIEFEFICIVRIGL